MLRRRALRGSRGVLGAPDHRDPGSPPVELDPHPSTPATAATCFWLTSESSACLERVAPEVRRELAGAMVELERVPGPADTVGHEECSGCWARQLEVAALAVTAGTLVRSGSSVLVAHRLVGVAERGLARSQAGTFVEISLDGSEGPVVAAPVPVTYRVVDRGELVERTILESSPEPTGRPEVFVDGRRGPASVVAAGIVDVLTRAGWLSRSPRADAAPRILGE
jgi:hypothetical protein